MARLGADATEPGQTRHLLGVGVRDGRIRHGGIALGLGGRDLFEHEFQPPELALDLAAQALRQVAPVAGAHLLQPLPTVASQRLERVDALGGEQALDPVDVLHPLRDQALALAMRAPRILALDRGHLHHAAGGVIAAAPRHQGPEQHGRVEPVGLGPSRAAVDLEAAGIHDEAGDRLGREAALQPEAVVPGLVAEDDRDLSAGAALFASLQAAQQGEQALHVAAAHPVCGGLPARDGLGGQEPCRLAEFQRDEHSNLRQICLDLFTIKHGQLRSKVRELESDPISSSLHGIFGHSGRLAQGVGPGWWKTEPTFPAVAPAG